MKKNLVIAIVLGNTISWADFALYAYFSPILSNVFFSFSTASTAYILYFIVFAIGFFFRPLGSAIAGSYADKHGRKNTLLITVLISSFATCAIGFLPSYESIGFFSPLLLTLLRIIQTMAISAEPTNSGALLMESSPVEKRGLYASYVMVGVFLGFLLGIFSFLLVTELMPVAQIKLWGWRIPYISSLLIGLVVAWVLLIAEESPEFLKKRNQGALLENPLATSFKTEYVAIWYSFGYGIMMAVANYFLLGFIPNYLNDHIHIPLRSVNLYITISLALTVLLIPLMGILSDRVGRRPVMASGAIGFIVFGVPMMMMISSGRAEYIIIALIIYGLLLAPVASLVPIALSEMFPFAVRCSGSAIGYNFALTFFGGTTPIIAQGLLILTGNEISPFWYISSVALMHLLFIFFSKETRGQFS